MQIQESENQMGHSRLLKFRAWDIKRKKMFYRKLFEMNWYTTEKNTETGSNCWGAISGGQERFMQVMQYTGLKDKNGKEIYKGDIVICHPALKEDIAREKGKSYQVVYEAPSWMLKTKKDGSFAQGGNGWWNTLEVIGNIYEHPDLLAA